MIESKEFLRIIKSDFHGVKNIFGKTSFDEVDYFPLNEVLIKIIRHPKNPLRIQIEEETLSVILDEEILIEFINPLFFEVFMNDLFFILENHFKVPEKTRQTLPSNDIAIFINEKGVINVKDRKDFEKIEKMETEKDETEEVDETSEIQKEEK